VEAAGDSLVGAEGMIKLRAKLWPLLLLGLTLAVIIILAAGLSESTLRSTNESFPTWIFYDLQAEPSVPDTLPTVQPLSNNWRRLGLYLILGIFLLWLITLIKHPEARKRMLIRLIGYVFLILVIYVVFSNFRQLQPPTPTGDDDVAIGSDGLFAQETPPLPPDFVNEPPQWLVIVITLFIIAVILGVAWWVWQRRTKKSEYPARLIAREAQQAVQRLEKGSSLTDTVKRCYRDMSRVLADQRGITRQQAMTPREFEQYLAEAGLGDTHIQRLTRLFEDVRYGNTTAGEREKQEAVDCLNAIARVYGRAA
jgi:hypothetical protein